MSALVEHDDCVSVAFTDGSVGEYDLVIGADGIHSVVRDLVIGGMMPTFAGQIAWRSWCGCGFPGSPEFTSASATAASSACAPVGDDVTYGFGNVSSDRLHDPLEGRLRAARDRFAHFGPTVADYLARLDRDEQIHCSPIEWIEQSNWRTVARRAHRRCRPRDVPDDGSGRRPGHGGCLGARRNSRGRDPPSRPRSRPMRKGVDLGSAGSSNRAGPWPRASGFRPETAIRFCANTARPCCTSGSCHWWPTPDRGVVRASYDLPHGPTARRGQPQRRAFARVYCPIRRPRTTPVRWSIRVWLPA